MLKILLHFLFAAIIPAVFVFYYIDAGQAEGWGGWAYGVALGMILIASAITGLVVFVISFFRWWKLKQDWYLWLTDFCIVSSPVLFVVFLQLVATSTEANQSIEEQEWFACHADYECKAVWLSCQGWAGVNVEYEHEYIEWYLKENNDFLSRVECDGPVKNSQESICKNTRCELID